jgi:nucleotide-binding universal stress UspA family protein
MSLPLDWRNISVEQEARYPEIKAQIAEARIQLQALVAQARSRGLQAKDILVFDSSLNNLVQHLQAQEHQLVVMGSHGASGFQEIFIGSNAQRVLRQSPAPVLVVKQYTGPFEPKQIVFASNFEPEAQNAFAPVAALAQKTAAKIQLVYINTPYRFEESWKSLGRLYEFVKAYPQQSLTPYVYNAFDEESGILHFAQAYGMDIIALATHGKGNLSQLLSPSIAEAVANRAKTAVLSIRIV